MKWLKSFWLLKVQPKLYKILLVLSSVILIFSMLSINAFAKNFLPSPQSNLIFYRMDNSRIYSYSPSASYGNDLIYTIGSLNGYTGSFYNSCTYSFPSECVGRTFNFSFSYLVSEYLVGGGPSCAFYYYDKNDGLHTIQPESVSVVDVDGTPFTSYNFNTTVTKLSQSDPTFIIRFSTVFYGASEQRIILRNFNYDLRSAAEDPDYSQPDTSTFDEQGSVESGIMNSVSGPASAATSEISSGSSSAIRTFTGSLSALSNAVEYAFYRPGSKFRPLVYLSLGIALIPLIVGMSINGLRSSDRSNSYKNHGGKK